MYGKLSIPFDPEDPPDISKQPEKYNGVYMNRLLSSTYTPRFGIQTAYSRGSARKGAGNRRPDISL